MQEPTEPPLIKPQTETPNLAAENPRDNKNRIISRLKNISQIVSSTNEEQAKHAESHAFNDRTTALLKLGNGYIQYLETHIDEITDEKTFQTIASLAKTSLLMNIEQYALTIRGISIYVSQHAELNDLNPQGKNGPWSNIKEALYFSVNNDIREKFRERILTRAKELIQNGEFSLRDVDHLERFFLIQKADCHRNLSLDTLNKILSKYNNGHL